MAKSFVKKEKEVKKHNSSYGTHVSMMCSDHLSDQTPSSPTRKIVCKDERGKYITIARNVDSGYTDPYRVMGIKNRVALCVIHGIESKPPSDK